MASGLQTILEIWQEHKYGFNGGPDLKKLERFNGVRWWNNKSGETGRQHWNMRVETCLEVQQRMDYVMGKRCLIACNWNWMLQ